MKEYEEIIALQKAHIAMIKDVVNGTINDMLRQTIEQKSHKDRNYDMRNWSRRLIILLDLIDSDMNTDEIPF